MINGVVEVAEDNRYLSLYRGFLVVSEKDNELGRVPISDVAVVILSANRATISKPILIALAEQNSVVVFCGRNYLPTSMSLPYCSNYEAAHRMKQQISASKPLCKRLWQVLIKKKIENQANVLVWRGQDKAAENLYYMIPRVRSGDPDNIEGRAARNYWSKLLSSKFKRNRHAEDENIFFNYCYTVLRSAVARAVVGAGLLPALGVHHRGRLNPFSLVDDLIEPYRPLADSIVLEALDENEEAELTPLIKRKFASLLHLDLETEQGRSPLMENLHNLAYELVKSYETGEVGLHFGEMLLPEKILSKI